MISARPRSREAILIRPSSSSTEGFHRFEEHGVAFGAYRAIIMLGDVCRRRAQMARRRHPLRTGVGSAASRCTSWPYGADILEGLAQVAVAIAAADGGSPALRRWAGLARDVTAFARDALPRR
ncbi:MAG: hypothetical protein WKF73_10665 [Nocardioidaceae bacterium]